MPKPRPRAKKSFGAGGKLSQLASAASWHPLIDASPRSSREPTPTTSDENWVEADAPLEDLRRERERVSFSRHRVFLPLEPLRRVGQRAPLLGKHVRHLLKASICRTCLTLHQIQESRHAANIRV